MTPSNNPQDDRSWFRSPLLMNADDTALLIIDVQERLAPHINQIEAIIDNTKKLIQGAKLLSVPIVVTEQYPSGLGETVSELKSLLSTTNQANLSEKTMFSCRECSRAIDALVKTGTRKLLLCGIETHVCVAQTAFDLTANGFEVYLCVDAMGSRNRIDHETAIKRMDSNGCNLTTTEAALFEWCVKAGSESFKALSKLVK